MLFQKDYLERQLADVEERFKRDIDGYQDQIIDLQGQLDKIKSEMADRLREYQDLLAVKLGEKWNINIKIYIKFNAAVDNATILGKKLYVAKWVS